MSNPPVPFTWAVETNYPAGSNAWNGQALAVAPANDYFSPSPASGSPAKIPAENVNYVLARLTGDISNLYQNGILSVTNVAALRALAVPAFNQTVNVPRGGGANVVTSSNYTSPGSYSVGFGGDYYYDGAYDAVDNGCTAIRPTANPSGPGMWRLLGGPLFTCVDQYYDATLGNNGSTTHYTMSPGIADGNNYGFTRSGTGPGFYQIALATGAGPGNIYLGDIINVDSTFLVGLSTSISLTTISWLMNASSSGGIVSGTLVGFPASVELVTPGGAAQFTARCKFQYVVQASDITLGALSFQPVFNCSAISTTGTTGTIIDVAFTVRRP